jgi:hypothetical protein
VQQDIVTVLGEDHVRLTQLSRTLRACSRASVAILQFNEYAVLLGGHLTAIRKVVYPALKAIGWKDVSSTLLVGHAKLAHAFAEVLTLPKSSGQFADALSDLLDATERLLECERHHLFPILRAELAPDVRLALAVDAAQYLVPPAVRQTHRDWIEEARLLMGAMHPAPTFEPPPP